MAVRKHKEALQKAIEADELNLGSKYLEKLLEIYEWERFSVIREDEQAMILLLIGKFIMYKTGDVKQAEQFIIKAHKRQLAYTKILWAEYSSLKKGRNPYRKPTKKLEEFLVRIRHSKAQYQAMRAIQAEIILQYATVGENIHCQNLVNKILEETEAEPRMNLQTRASVRLSRILSKRYSRTSLGRQNDFEKELLDFQNSLQYHIDNRREAGNKVPERMYEILYKTYIYEAVQLYRKGSVKDAIDALFTPLQVPNRTQLRAVIQKLFMEVFNSDFNLIGLKEHLLELEKYDMPPDLKLMWLITLVEASRRLGDIKCYKKYLSLLEERWTIAGKLLQASFRKRYEQAKDIENLG